MSVQRYFSLIILILLIATGCNIPFQTPTIADSPTSPPKATCTPPLCQEGEVYSFGDCGSCCTTCATPIPSETPFGPTECPPVPCAIGQVYSVGDCGSTCCTTCATPTFYPMCTPPYCQEGEMYIGGDCPGACCTRCGTPTPQEQRPPANICPILVTRTPPPGAPTRIADTPSAVYVDPHVEVCVTRLTLHPGEYLYVNAFAVDIGLAYYSLMIQDAGSPDINTEVRLEGSTWRGIRLNSQVLEVHEVTGDYNRASFYLRAVAPGAVDLWVPATGEIHYGYPGPAMWAGGGSVVIHIEVIPWN